MPTFRLKTYPNVCRMCLQAKPSAEMVSLDSYRPQFSRSVAEMLEEVASVKIPMVSVQDGFLVGFVVIEIIFRSI